MRARPVKLELLRAGPMHNQLLSPLTPYLALCGDSSPVTFRIEHEHHAFLAKLERLRYALNQRQGAVAVPDRVREAAADEVGRDVARILESVPSLLAEISRQRREDGADTAPSGAGFVHLSLVLGGSELSLIPFEFAFAPQAHPGEGMRYFLQTLLATVPTRETRRRLPDPPDWDCPGGPKVLFIAAAPGGLQVPLREHLAVLRGAVEPWVAWPRPAPGADASKIDERERLPMVRQRLRVLSQASLEQVYEICAAEAFTHVHILAHGGHYERAGERQFGLVLCDHADPSRAQVISGERLGKALRAQSGDGSRRAHPLVVTLATCDSANPGSVLVPGGSIAHELHAEGIPWVLASQFPLTKAGSVQMAAALYPGLLRGDDPRHLLHELRRRLFMRAERDHDWASIVAYASVPVGFDDQVRRCFEAQSRQAIEVGLARADDLRGKAGLAQVLARVEDVLEVWRKRLPVAKSRADKVQRAECFGMHGSTAKRIALAHYRDGDAAAGERELKKALGFYRQAMTEGGEADRYYWVASQALALAAVLDEPAEPETFDKVEQMAVLDLANPQASDQAWAHGTLAELALIGLHHKPRRANTKAVLAEVRRNCRRIVESMGPASFHVESTRRQFQRYVDYWPLKYKEIAKAAVAVLTPP